MSAVVRRALTVGCLCRAAALLALFVPGLASAHVPPVAGKLVDCIQRSDAIVAGVVETISDIDRRIVEVTLRVDRVLFGSDLGPRIAFRGEARFAAGERYVVFLHRDGTRLVGVQPSGTFFPSKAADDQAYEQVITAARAALASTEDVRVERLRAALIPALQAVPEPLRYHAALELAALAHHGALSAAQRSQLEAIAATPGTDPTLRRMIELLLAPAGP